MALDEPTEQDEIKTEDGFRLIVSKALLDEFKGIHVDYLTGPLRRGFQVKAATQTGCESSCC